MKKVFTEIGFGNDTFLSTEFEYGDTEHRVPRFVVPDKVTEVYFRFWIFRKVFILSSKNGLVIQNKDRNELKILFGLGGNNL